MHALLHGSMKIVTKSSGAIATHFRQAVRRVKGIPTAIRRVECRSGSAPQEAAPPRPSLVPQHPNVQRPDLDRPATARPVGTTAGQVPRAAAGEPR
jgi:hypothetical protein